jgi:4-aminobutyrate aminotransferase
VACAAALATIQLIEEGLMANAASAGDYLKERLTALRARHAVIGHVRGLGLMIGVDFERADGSHASDGKLRDQAMQRCFEKGLLLLGCGESTLRFCPPLIVNSEEIDTAVQIFDAVLGELK